jgi:hypothetical protein
MGSAMTKMTRRDFAVSTAALTVPTVAAVAAVAAGAAGPVQVRHARLPTAYPIAGDIATGR